MNKIVAWFRIPRGEYCYGRNHKPCPFWSVDKTKPEQENGYCSYLGLGDWDINEDKKWTSEKRLSDGTYVKDETLLSGHEIGLPMSLLWDQCKECNAKTHGHWI
jgi:hypothetical protein